MRARLMTLAAGAAALATGLALPATVAQAALASASSVPKPHQSLYVAGYQQTGCHHQGYPVYVEISGTPHSRQYLGGRDAPAGRVDEHHAD